MSQPTIPLVQGGRALLRVRVFGFPVRLDWSFVIIVGLLGYYPGVTATNWLMWLLIAPLAVLVHELGHAVVARGAGAAPEITLAGFGGLTSYRPPRRLSRGRSISISLAGPAVGLLAGAALLAYGRSAVLAPGSLAAGAWWAAVFTTLGWSLLNLLPILPLDGGQALREMLPGDDFTRQRTAAFVSVAVGAGVALLAVKFGYTFGALLAGLLVFNNVLALRQPRPQPPSPRDRLVGLLWDGRTAEAAALLDAQPGAAASGDGDSSGIDPLLRAAVLAVDPARAETGRVLLDREARSRPGDPDALAVLTLVAMLRNDWDTVIGAVSRTEAPLVPAVLVLRAQQQANGADRSELAARIGQTWLDAAAADPSAGAGVEAAAEVGYATAQAWAAAGRVSLGVDALTRAAGLGFTDLARLDIDPRLEPLRGQPGYQQARETVRQTALAAERAAGESRPWPGPHRG